MRSRISFRCGTCNARLQASIQFVGRSCDCPRCREKVVIPPQVPDEEAPVLVFDDGQPSRRGSRWQRI
jgi:DNA-directed RNA polymerase subunit RPC12/RpoP